MNDKFGVEDAPFLTDDDVQRAAPLIPGYGSRTTAAPAYAASNQHFAYAPTYGSHRRQGRQTQYDYYDQSSHYGQRTHH